jgi:uncharacterized protein (DUF305 family)
VAEMIVQASSIKVRLIALTLGAIAPLITLLTACGTDAQTQAQSSSPSPSNMAGMDHGSSGHNMSMDLGPADADLDMRFIDAMIPHHQGAIEMAKEVQQKSKRAELQTLAKEIIQAQNKEISQMKQWRKAWYPKAIDTPMAWHAQMGHMMAMSTEQMQAMMMRQDLGAADTQFDLRFLNAMIPHHEGALVMAKEVLTKSKRPEIQTLAKAIISSQETEIKQMMEWRVEWYEP